MKELFRANKPLIILFAISILLVVLVISLLIFGQYNQGEKSASPTSTPRVLPFTPERYDSLEEKKAAQTKSDREYAEKEKEAYENFPWATKLPLKGIGYFVIFEPNKSQFTAKLYPKTSESSETDSLKQIVLRELRNIGVDTALYQIRWVITPAP